VLCADDRQVVFVPAACGTQCDLDNGSSRFLPGNPGYPIVPAFSRDGRRVAIGYAGMLPDDPSTGPQRDGYVIVVDQSRSDFWRLVPEVTTGANSTALPVWAPDGSCCSRCRPTAPVRAGWWSGGRAPRGSRSCPAGLPGSTGCPGWPPRSAERRQRVATPAVGDAHRDHRGVVGAGSGE
jgi:hypothetical protein